MAEPEQPPLSPAQQLELAETLIRWANEHPRPNEPLFGFAGRELLSPQELATAVLERTEAGEQFLYAARFVTEIISFEEYLQAFDIAATGPVQA